MYLSIARSTLSLPLFLSSFSLLLLPILRYHIIDFFVVIYFSLITFQSCSVFSFVYSFWSRVFSKSWVLVWLLLMQIKHVKLFSFLPSQRFDFVPEKSVILYFIVFLVNWVQFLIKFCLVFFSNISSHFFWLCLEFAGILFCPAFFVFTYFFHISLFLKLLLLRPCYWSHPAYLFFVVFILSLEFFSSSSQIPLLF